jgi:transposase-like protein
MRRTFADDPDESRSPEAGDPAADGLAAREAEVWCPYCGEPNLIGVDPGSGSRQRYVEDCTVCCQPWQVIVQYARDGRVAVTLRTLDDP